MAKHLRDVSHNNQRNTGSKQKGSAQTQAAETTVTAPTRDQAIEEHLETWDVDGGNGNTADLPAQPKYQKPEMMNRFGTSLNQIGENIGMGLDRIGMGKVKDFIGSRPKWQVTAASLAGLYLATKYLKRAKII